MFIIIYLLILAFLGFIITASVGLMASWIDRKVTARLQYRVGPPLMQPLTDLIKLFAKETLVPAGSVKQVFLLAPFIGVAVVIAVSTMLLANNLSFSSGFVGDLIVIIYLLVMPSVSIILGGFASRNPLASLGASREMKLILGYELPFLLVILVPVIKSGFSLRLSEILSYQLHHGAIASSLSGTLALIVAIFCIQAKLGLVPFDVAEAETELAGGALIEYSGPPLAMYRLMKNMLLFTLPFFLMIMFCSGWGLGGKNIVLGFLKYIGLVTALVVIRNTNPRLRIDQIVRFFWGPMTVIAIAAVILALNGL